MLHIQLYMYRINDKYRGKLRAFGMATECYNCSLNSFADTITKYIDLAYKLYYLEKKAICTKNF